jgi:chromosome segregation ATPase
MQQADEQIQRIRQKIQMLLKQQASLQKTNHELRQEVNGLRKEKEQYLISIDELQQQLAVLKAAKSELSADEKKAFEKRLGQYIKEIDRCITTLSE